MLIYIHVFFFLENTFFFCNMVPFGSLQFRSSNVSSELPHGIVRCGRESQCASIPQITTNSFILFGISAPAPPCSNALNDALSNAQFEYLGTNNGYRSVCLRRYLLLIYWSQKIWCLCQLHNIKCMLKSPLYNT